MDKYDIPFVIKNINDEMPKHTDKTVQIKCSFSQGLPKNLKEYSAKIDNKFLNDNLAIIEEINHRDNTHWIPKWFQEYQNKIYGDSEILNHDNFFKAHLHDSFFNFGYDTNGLPKNTRYYRPMSIQNAAFLAPKKINSVDLTVTTSTVTDYGTGNFNTVFGFPFNSSAVVGASYNTMYYNAGAVAGSIRMAVYGDSAGQPGALTKETGSNLAVTGLNAVTVTNFIIATAVSYQAFNVDSVSYHYLGNSGDGIARNQRMLTFGAMPDPFARTSVPSGGFYGQVKDI